MDNKRNRQECSLDFPKPKSFDSGTVGREWISGCEQTFSKAMSDFMFKTLMAVLFVTSDEVYKTPWSVEWEAKMDNTMD